VVETGVVLAEIVAATVATVADVPAVTAEIAEIAEIVAGTTSTNTFLIFRTRLGEINEYSG